MEEEGDRLASGNDFEFAGGIAHFLCSDTGTIQHREIEVGKRGFFWEDDVASGSDGAAATTGQNDGQVVVIVAIRISNPAAEDDHAIIEQGAVAFFDRFELLKEISELGGVKLIYFGQHLQLFRVALMVRKPVVSIAHPDLGEGAVGAVMR